MRNAQRVCRRDEFPAVLAADGRRQCGDVHRQYGDGRHKGSQVVRTSERISYTGDGSLTVKGWDLAGVFFPFASGKDSYTPAKITHRFTLDAERFGQGFVVKFAQVSAKVAFLGPRQSHVCR